MSFICPIEPDKRHGLDVVRVKVPPIVPDPHGDREHEFIFDTGCQITMVSEDVATKLGLPLPSGGPLVNITGSTAKGYGRLVEVRFRFPPDANGKPGLEVDSTWVVVSGATDIALLGFMEVHRHYGIRSQEFNVFFISWASLRGLP